MYVLVLYYSTRHIAFFRLFSVHVDAQHVKGNTYNSLSTLLLLVLRHKSSILNKAQEVDCTWYDLRVHKIKKKIELDFSRLYTPRGGGGTLIFSYIRRLWSFLGLKILHFNIFFGFQIVNTFWGMEILWIFFGGHHKIGLYLGFISMHFSVFF